MQQTHRDSFAEDVRAGLTSQPKTLPPKYFYEALGSQLFEAICWLPEYYPTRAEAEIFHRHAADIISQLPAPFGIVELGSGSSVKTRLLIEAILARQAELHRCSSSAGRMPRTTRRCTITAASWAVSNPARSQSATR